MLGQIGEIHNFLAHLATYPSQFHEVLTPLGLGALAHTWSPGMKRRIPCSAFEDWKQKFSA